MNEVISCPIGKPAKVMRAVSPGLATVKLGIFFAVPLVLTVILSDCSATSFNNSSISAESEPSSRVADKTIGSEIFSKYALSCSLILLSNMVIP